jgi:serine/threonine-protein kinase SRK2
MLGCSRGACSAVYQASEHETGAAVAAKVAQRGDGTVPRYFEDEFVTHRKLALHPHVIQFKEVFLTDDYLCLTVMEFAAGGALL